MTSVVPRTPACRVLIVEDDREVAEPLRRQITALAAKGRFEFDVSTTDDILVALDRAQNAGIDIFVVDLGLQDPENNSRISPNVGLKYLPHLATYNNVGIIVYSSEDRNAYYEKLIDAGVDDYIQKTDPIEYVTKKIIALWRRAIAVRSDALQFTTGFERRFQIGSWRFTVGIQRIEGPDGASIHLGLTEHELLKCLCLAVDNTLSEDEIGAFAFKRTDFANIELRKSLENLIYRIRKKIGGKYIVYIGGGRYRIDATELK